MSTSDAAASLSPSEEVLFYADQLVPKGGMLKGKEDALLAEGNVAVNPLAEQLFAAAILGLEKAGAVRLEDVQKKALFGLMKRQVVEVARAGGAQPYPAGTLEEILFRHVPAAGPIEVSDLIYNFFTEDMQWPHKLVIDAVKAGLGDRGLLHLEQVKKMLVFTSLKATVPPEVKAALQGRSPDAARALVTGAEGRGELWKHLQKGISGGLARRTETQAGNDPYSTD